MTAPPVPFERHHSGSYLHGTKAVLEPGAVLTAGRASNFEAGRIYIVEPLGNVEDDPNVTVKRFPGNPTLSYRSARGVGTSGYSGD